MTHCWKDLTEHLEETGRHGTDEWAASLDESATCMLEDGHDGPHAFVSDREIGVTFHDVEPEQS